MGTPGRRWGVRLPRRYAMHFGPLGAVTAYCGRRGVTVTHEPAEVTCNHCRADRRFAELAR